MGDEALSDLSEAKRRSEDARQRLASELRTAEELERRLAKVRAEVAAKRQLLAHELLEEREAEARLREARKRRARQALKDEHLEDLCEALLLRAKALLQSGGADLEAAGGNKALPEAREAAQVVAQLEDLGHGDDELYRQLLEFSLRGLQSHLEEDDPEVLARVHSLGVSLENLGEKFSASEHYQRAYEGRCKRLGKEHQDTLDSAHNLASCLRSLGKNEEAAILLQVVLERSQRAFGESNRVALEAAESLAELGELREDFVAAWRLRRQLLQWHRSASGEESPAALAAMARLAQVLAAAALRGGAAPEAALEALKASAARHRKVLGADSVEAQQAAEDLASFLAEGRPPRLKWFQASEELSPSGWAPAPHQQGVHA